MRVQVRVIKDETPKDLEDLVNEFLLDIVPSDVRDIKFSTNILPNVPDEFNDYTIVYTAMITYVVEVS